MNLGSENELLDYYNGDEFAAGVWEGKYAVKDHKQRVMERTPDTMHRRMAVRIAEKLNDSGVYSNDLSQMGKKVHEILTSRGYSKWLGADAMQWVEEYLKRYRYIIPQGSIMSILGNPYVVGSLSNCFVIPPPLDSYGGIFKTDQQIAQLEKRRGGVGTNLNTLRPEGNRVLNAAGTSTGAHSFMDRYSNTTREVAQNGRRGALMLLMSCLHPDIFKFVVKKEDLTKVTGANISSMLTDSFMRAALKDDDFVCRFPIDHDMSDPVVVNSTRFNIIPAMDLTYNELEEFETVSGKKVQFMKIKAKELFDLIVDMAWKSGEPGVAFIDTIINYSPEGVYERYRPVASNPCGEQWMNAYDACRLLALNLYGVVINPWTKDATIDYDRLYEIAYVQQYFADAIVDLEIEYVENIIKKISSDPEPADVKATELDLWINIRDTAKASRRTGCGFTALADMLAALGLKYDSEEAISTIKKVMKTKMRGELDATIDLAILKGTFDGWDKNKEFNFGETITGKNDFYDMLLSEFPEQCERMIKYGRRNVSWSTVAPTGTVSIVALLDKHANTSAGVEPQYACFYFRNKKVNPSDTNVRVDFTDQNGDSWMTYPIVMGGLKEWIERNHSVANFMGVENLPKEAIEDLFKKSPYYGSCANDISWEQRVRIQSLVQRYTTNAISSTLNLPNTVSKEVVSSIYKKAWELKLKGVTIYRDGCRTGVLNLDKKKESSFTYMDAYKRPKEIDSELHVVMVKGVKYGVVVGLIDEKPYELFAFNLPEEIKQSCKGKTVKQKKGHYNFVCEGDSLVKDLQFRAIHRDEQLLTRMISANLRHGAKPQFIMEQIDKCDLDIPTFGSAVKRVLKKYCNEEELVNRNTCKDCGSADLRMQEGCLVCNSCGTSRCG